MLEEYNRKRKFIETPEPIGTFEDASSSDIRNHFVIQKHHASRLHYDLRLETEGGILKSWAVPKGISLDPRVKRLAILTEDHPMDYLLFEGTIPEGNYGAGTVTVWDTGTYALERASEKFSELFDKGKIVFELNGYKVRGKFSLIRTGRENQWLIIKSYDQFTSEEDLTSALPWSVLSQPKREQEPSRNRKGARDKIFYKLISSRKKDASKIGSEVRNVDSVHLDNTLMKIQNLSLSHFPNTIKPMLSTPIDKPFNDTRWDFEIKWDGVRVILFYHKGKNILELKSRTNKSISHRYPEIISSLVSSLTELCQDSIVLDGEIVILDEQGRPDFQSHQRRMNVDNALDIQYLSREIPATLYVFDILYLNGKNLESLKFLERRVLLSKVIDPSLNREKVIRISESFEGRGVELFEEIRELNLEGIIAKDKNSKYLQGARTTDWLKIKHVSTQDCVVIGYTRGEGSRKGYFGSLLLAAYNGKLRFIGHSGSGFDLAQIIFIYNRLQKIRTEEIPVNYIPYTNRDPIWVQPLIVAEVKFDGWTKDKIMRAPIFSRIRDDKKPQDCTIEKTRQVGELSNIKPQVAINPSSVSVPSSTRSRSDLSLQSISGTIADEGERAYSFSNLTKTFWPSTRYQRRLTKGDLIEYYDKISDYILPLLKDRPLSLNRYPDGISGKHFYQKNWSMDKPEFVNSIKLYSESVNRETNYLICNNKETLLWLVNLGCIEMHPWYSRVLDYDACLNDSSTLDEEQCGLDHPDFIVFDLDPYIYSGSETETEQEPEFNRRAFMKIVEVAQLMKLEIFDELKIKSYVKTSGKTGIHIFVPVSGGYTYDQTRSFAEIIGKTMVTKQPDNVTMEWDISKRRGKVFFDHSRNARGKTVASVFSARPTPLATISMPLGWDLVDHVLPTDFTILNVSDQLPKKDIRKSLSSWGSILESRQDLTKMLENSS
jgi:bifunctional non-homologous end joining protein LigD